ncbi:hypothetical protein SanJ4211_1070c [Streptococcus anginosus]|nr:hypothetical protein SAIN_1070 [Streptococcus anginosus C1051]ALL03157.1 hypothetical protein SanJ4211_1070c [Streptococcus anginosus]
MIAMKKKQTVNHKDLMELGFPEHTARDIIKQAKTIAVQLFEESRESSGNVIKLSRSPFENSRLNLAPTYIVEELLGFELLSEQKGA